MATTNLKLFIKKTGQEISPKYVFQTVATADDYLRIPRRYPFADVTAPTGFFRHSTTTVSSELGGSSTTNTEGVLGFELPRTEKLILLVKKGATTAETLTLEGSLEYGVADRVISVPAGAIGDVYEIDLFDFGLFIAGVAGEHGMSIKVGHTTLGVCLIARMA